MGAWKMKWLLVFLVARIWLACSQSTTESIEDVQNENHENIHLDEVNKETIDNVLSTRHLDEAPKENDEKVRSTRQLDFIECCPCPGSERSLADAVGAASTRSTDDCPCRGDSEGSSSVLFPSLRNAVSALRPSKSKEDVKPLLHPEVDLASNVLQTLREATDEEYREALARDAARAAARSSDPDIITDPDETEKSVVTIVINPKTNESDDDTLSEASHVHEARCIPSSLGSKRNRVGLQKSSNLRDILHLPKQRHLGILHKNLLDMNNGASNVQESVVIPGDGLKSLPFTLGQTVPKSMFKSRDYSSLLNKSLKPKYKQMKTGKNAMVENSFHNNSSSNLSSKVPNLKFKNSKTNIEETQTAPSYFNKQSIPRVRANEDLADDVKNYHKLISESLFPKLPNLKLKTGIDNILDKMHDNKSLSRPRASILKKPLIPQMKPEGNDDSFVSATNNHDYFKSRAAIIPNFKASINMPEDLRTTKAPLILNNIMKFRDVELLSPNEVLENIKIPLINIPDFRMPEALKKLENIVTPFKQFNDNKVSPLFRDAIKIKPNKNEQVSASDVVIEIKNAAGAETNIHVIPQTKKVTTEILDSVPKPSDIKDSLIAPTNNIENEGITDQFPYSENSVESGSCDLTTYNVDISDNKEEPVTSLPEKSSLSDPGLEDHNDSSELGKDHVQLEDCENEDDASNLESDPTNEISLTWNTTTRSDNSRESADDVEKPELKALSPFDKISSWKQKLFKKLTKDDTKELRQENPTSLNSFRSDEMSEPCSDEVKDKSPLFGNVDRNSSFEDDLKELDQSSNESNKKEVQFHDLQKMSDSILESSMRQEQTAFDSAERRDTTELNLRSDEENSEETISETTNNDSEDHTEENFGNPNTSNETEQANTDESELVTTEKTCKIETAGKNKKSDKSSETEMSAQASETRKKLARPMSSILSGYEISSPLRQSIVQPTTLTDLFTRPIPNIFESLNLNPQVPTLDDIRSRIANILGTDANDEDDEISSADFDPNIDSTNMKSVMSPEASTSSVSSLRPLKDINLNIFQMTPLQSIQKGLRSQSYPGLNLNSFKAKLSVPKTLNIEPLKLESAIGDKGSLFGARFSVGTDKQRKSQQPKQRLKSTFIDGYNLNLFPFGNPLGNVPKFDELRSVMRNNMQNFLKTAQPSLLSGSLHSSPLSSLTEDIRSQTENTFSTLHKSLRPKLLSESLTKPNNFLEMVSQKHEDFQDKLKGLHYDLTDRLSSLHENVLDHSLFSSRDDTPNPRLRSSKLSYQNSLSSQPKNERSSYKTKKTPRISSQSKSDRREMGKIKTFRMPTAASSLVETKLESPQTKINSLKPRTSDNDSENINGRNFILGGKSNIYSRPEQPLFKKFKPLTKSKVTISFSTTPRSLTALPGVVTTSKTAVASKSDFKTRAAEWLAKRKKTKDAKSIDSQISPSEHVRIKTLPLGKHADTLTKPSVSESLFETKQKIDEKLANGKFNLKLTKERLGIPKTSILDLKKPLLPNLKSSSLFSTPAKTNILEGPIKSGIFNIKPLEKMSEGKSSGTDMTLSPSQNIDTSVAIAEPLKENIPYKCKLMCTKEQK